MIKHLKRNVIDVLLSQQFFWSEMLQNVYTFCWNCDKLLQVCNETDAQLIISKYKKNTIKRKRKASYRSEKIMCFSLKVLVSN